MAKVGVTRRGVYLDLTKSPYEFKTPYGDLFKFSSQKKLEIYQRDIQREINKACQFLDRIGLEEHLPPEIVSMIFREVYKAFYARVER